MKKKLRLQIEKLRVEQFEAHPDSPVERGTVQGFESHSCGGTNPWDGFCICQPMPETMGYPPCP
jgi:hypothetical protein